MTKHIVFYRLREDCDKAAAIAEIRAALEALVGVIPGLVVMQIRPAEAGSFDYVLYSEFSSDSALEQYRSHPAHLAVKPLVHRYISQRVFAEFRV